MHGTLKTKASLQRMKMASLGVTLQPALRVKHLTRRRYTSIILPSSLDRPLVVLEIKHGRKSGHQRCVTDLISHRWDSPVIWVLLFFSFFGAKKPSSHNLQGVLWEGKE